MLHGEEEGNGEEGEGCGEEKAFVITENGSLIQHMVCWLLSSPAHNTIPYTTPFTHPTLQIPHPSHTPPFTPCPSHTLPFTYHTLHIPHPSHTTPFTHPTLHTPQPSHTRRPYHMTCSGATWGGGRECGGGRGDGKEAERRLC